MKTPILYFFLLVLTVHSNLTPDVIHKRSRFSKTSPKKSLIFVPYEGCSSVMFNPDLILLSVEVDPIPEEQYCKKDTFVVFSSSDFQMVLTLPTEVKTFYMQVSKV